MLNPVETLVFLIFSALAGVVAGSLIDWGWMTMSHADRDWTFVEYWRAGIPIATAFGICLGLPATILFRRMEWRRWWQYVGGAALIAAPCYLFAADELGWAYFSCSAASGLIYWRLSSI